MKKFVATLLILGLFAMAGLAQVTTGRIEGTVTDAQGATVPGAKVKVLNKETGLTLETTTSATRLSTHVPELPLNRVGVGEVNIKLLNWVD